MPGKLRVLTMAVFLAGAACGGETGPKVPPPEIRGTWTTDDSPRYEDRAFEIREEEIFFQTGPDDFTVHSILTVELDPQAPKLHVLEYTGAGREPNLFQFYYSDKDQGTIRFKNQPEIAWHRAPDLRVPWSRP